MSQTTLSEMPGFANNNEEVESMSQDIYETPASTPNFKTALAAQLQNLIPEAIADGKVDVAKLQELLGDDADNESERFGLFWPGKLRAIRAAQEPTTATLTPEPKLSKDWDTTKNVYIEGDNLEVLKILQKHYHGKIKMIYIDPPYNTGKDFVYPDNYKEGLKTYLEWTEQVNEDGQRTKSNPETDGRYHSNWLSMMYPRLKLARNLLTEDGVVFISIDDNEVSDLTRLCGEIFGESNFVADFIWNHRKSSQNDTDVSLAHNYTLTFAKDRSRFRLNSLPVDPKKFSNPDNDPRGPWVADPFDAPNIRPNLTYPITNPVTGEQFLPPKGRHWRFSQEKFLSIMSENKVVFGKNGRGRPQLKRFLSEAQIKGNNSSTLWTHLDTATNATKELMRLFDGEKFFDTPKPISLIREILLLGTDKNSIILDFFSGSATTSHAVMQLNAEDGGTRRHIQVQLPELVDSNSAAGKSGFKTIADIGRRRIDLAGEKIKEDYAEQLGQRESPLDIGYRTYKLTDTNFVKWQETSDTDPSSLEKHLFELRDNANDDASELSLLTEVLLKQGYSLTQTIHEETVAGLKTFSVEDGLVLAYMDEHKKPTLEQLQELVDREPERLIVLEDAFQGDDELKTNLVQAAKTRHVELWTA
jgi:adenine-specific DNA-methyltransferase